MEVGLEIAIAENTWHGAAPRYAEIRALGRQAEEVGFDSLWVYDHLLYRAPGEPAEGIWEGWTILTALAEATERIGLGTLVSCAGFRNPAVLAKMAVTLDEVSGGRLTLGLGAGWNEAEFVAFGVPFDHRVSRFAEALAIVAPLLREGRVSFEGRYHRAADCEILPRGPRDAGPPLLLGGTGPRMLDLVARYADLWNAGYCAAPEDLSDVRARFEAACASAGRAPGAVGMTAAVKVAYPEKALVPARFEGRFLTGSADELAAGLERFEAAGFAHVMCTIVPCTTEAVERIGEGLACYRAGAS